jgi:hypothetical protein
MMKVTVLMLSIAVTIMLMTIQLMSRKTDNNDGNSCHNMDNRNAKKCNTVNNDGHNNIEDNNKVGGIMTMMKPKLVIMTAKK